ncbi:hypothetical protein FHS85_001424 [Rhodoligotrophos appendicifer]|uniref:hypothetical protein n=1 Tax=Rhodoligotrophos appendicifer TaxID=987056 RepID=UPI0011860371|nr:hypothetical protein [Rhodoligotrophos appendicifer]
MPTPARSASSHSLSPHDWSYRVLGSYQRSDGHPLIPTPDPSPPARFFAPLDAPETIPSFHFLGPGEYLDLPGAQRSPLRPGDFDIGRDLSVSSSLDSVSGSSGSFHFPWGKLALGGGATALALAGAGGAAYFLTHEPGTSGSSLETGAPDSPEEPSAPELASLGDGGSLAWMTA